MKANYKELGLLFLLLGMGAIMFASLIFVFEKEEELTTFHTMFDSYWWAIITMTTVSVPCDSQCSNTRNCHVTVSPVWPAQLQIVWPLHAPLKMTARNLSPKNAAMPCYVSMKIITWLFIIFFPSVFGICKYVFF